jgi:DNA invertase Pin-like site-specific DNA recombinase
MTITQTYQFASLGRTQTIERPDGARGFNRLRKTSRVFKGRPAFRRLLKAIEEGYNYCWLYTKVRGKPELVDGIKL